jgi:hypothetical protein
MALPQAAFSGRRRGFEQRGQGHSHVPAGRGTRRRRREQRGRLGLVCPKAATAAADALPNPAPAPRRPKDGEQSQVRVISSRHQHSCILCEYFINCAFNSAFTQISWRMNPCCLKIKRFGDQIYQQTNFSPDLYNSLLLYIFVVINCCRYDFYFLHMWAALFDLNNAFCGSPIIYFFLL